MCVFLYNKKEIQTLNDLDKTFFWLTKVTAYVVRPQSILIQPTEKKISQAAPKGRQATFVTHPCSLLPRSIPTPQPDDCRAQGGAALEHAHEMFKLQPPTTAVHT